MSAEELGSIAGLILSLAVAYFPKVSDWYNGFDAAGKARVMAGLLVLTALGVFAYGCIPASLVPCTLAGAKELLGVLIAALIANQAAFVLLVKPYRK